MTTNLGSTLKCSCLIPTFSMFKAPGFVIELSNGTKAIWHRGSSATSVEYKNLVGKEAIFTLTINSRAEVKETAYTVTDWTTYEESANVDVL